MASVNAGGSASSGVMSLKRMPGLGKSGMSRMYRAKSIGRSSRKRLRIVRLQFPPSEATMGFFVRPAMPADASTIVEFNRLLALESERVVLDEAVLRPGVRAILGDANRGRYFVADEGGQVIGQIM